MGEAAATASARGGIEAGRRRGKRAGGRREVRRVAPATAPARARAPESVHGWELAAAQHLRQLCWERGWSADVVDVLARRPWNHARATGRRAVANERRPFRVGGEHRPTVPCRGRGGGASTGPGEHERVSRVVDSAASWPCRALSGLPTRRARGATAAVRASAAPARACLFSSRRARRGRQAEGSAATDRCRSIEGCGVDVEFLDTSMYEMGRTRRHCRCTVHISRLILGQTRRGSEIKTGGEAPRAGRSKGPPSSSTPPVPS